jgi:hypothetical protein
MLKKIFSLEFVIGKKRQGEFRKGEEVREGFSA